MTNVETVRAIYAAWKRGDSARGWIAEDLEYVNPPDAIEPGTRHGRASLSAIRDAFDDVDIEPVEFIDAGTEVVVIAELRGTGRTSGVPIERRQGYVWTLKDGVAIRFRWFNDPAEALAAAGVTPQ